MINSLTSLRFIFAMMVFGAHCYIIDDFFDAHFFKEGFVGVNFFFVLSGFIIAYTYQENLLNRKLEAHLLGGSYGACLSVALVDIVYCHSRRRWDRDIGSTGLVSAFFSLFYIGQRLCAEGGLFFFVQ